MLPKMFTYATQSSFCRTLASALVSNLGHCWPSHLGFASEIARNLIDDLAGVAPPPRAHPSITTSVSLSPETAPPSTPLSSSSSRPQDHHQAAPALPDQFVLLSGALAVLLAPAAENGPGGSVALAPLLPDLLQALINGCLPERGDSGRSGSGQKEALRKEHLSGRRLPPLQSDSRVRSACACMSRLVPAIVRGLHQAGDPDGARRAAEQATATLLIPFLSRAPRSGPAPSLSSSDAALKYRLPYPAPLVFPPVLSSLLSILRSLCNSGLISDAKCLLFERGVMGAPPTSLRGLTLTEEEPLFPTMSLWEMLLSLRLGGDAGQIKASMAFLVECTKLPDSVRITF